MNRLVVLLRLPAILAACLAWLYAHHVTVWLAGYPFSVRDAALVLGVLLFLAAAAVWRIARTIRHTGFWLHCPATAAWGTP